jgi:hypothetical protein
MLYNPNAEHKLYKCVWNWSAQENIISEERWSKGNAGGYVLLGWGIMKCIENFGGETYWKAATLNNKELEGGYSDGA